MKGLCHFFKLCSRLVDFLAYRLTWCYIQKLF